jgi:hypothetical protein
MNERIRELAEQAGHKPLGTFADELMDIYNKKFAELIVRECCLLTEEYQHRVTFYRADETIKKHFGVEE